MNELRAHEHQFGYGGRFEHGLTGFVDKLMLRKPFPFLAGSSDVIQGVGDDRQSRLWPVT